MLLDTEVVLDFLFEREPHYRPTRLIMIAGRVGEFDLWMTSSRWWTLRTACPMAATRR